jgi:hypothetical protein
MPNASRVQKLNLNSTKKDRLGRSKSPLDRTYQHSQKLNKMKESMNLNNNIPINIGQNGGILKPTSKITKAQNITSLSSSKKSS